MVLVLAMAEALNEGNERGIKPESRKVRYQRKPVSGNVSARDERLALRELEASSRLGPAVLLALHGAGVAGQEPPLLQHAAKFGLITGKGDRDAVPDGAGLARQSTPSYGADDIVLALALGGNERLLQDHLQNGPREIGGMVLAGDCDSAGAALYPDAGDGVFPLAGGIGATLRVDLLLVDAGFGRARRRLQRSKVFKRHGLAHGLRRSLHSWR